MTRPNVDVDAELARIRRARKGREAASGNGDQQGKAALPVTDFAAMSTTSHKAWVVHHLLGAGETSVWYGEPGSGKSVLAEDLGLHVAAGRTWHGRKVGQGAVLYVALERASVVARRAIAFGMEHDLAGAVLPFAMLRGPLDFRDPNIATGIVATLNDLAKRHGCKAALIIVDTVSRALCGGDENSPKDMGQLIANLSRIQAVVGVHLLLTHHQPVDGKERMRGHGALLGAVDTTVHVTKGGASRSAEVVKSSDHEEGQRMAFTLKSITIDQDEHGDAITAPVVVEAQASASPTARKIKLPKNCKLAVTALREAVDDLGVKVASSRVPPSVKVATLDQWRDYAYRRGIGGSDPDSQRKAFTRAVEHLAADNMVGIWEPYAWPVN